MSVEPARRITRMVPGPESLSSRHAERVGRGSAQRNVPYFCPRVPVSAQQIPDAEVGRRHRQAPNLMVLRREESTVCSPYTFEVLAICAAEQSPSVRRDYGIMTNAFRFVIGRPRVNVTHSTLASPAARMGSQKPLR